MAKKTIGYLLLAAGLLAFAVSYESVRTALKIPLPAGISNTTLMIAGIVLAIIGAFIVFGKRKARHYSAEVPIFANGRIVGYRRS